MKQFLLRLMETSGRRTHETCHTIEAKNRQMVKYHYHRTLKNKGYVESGWFDGEKHTLEADGLTVELNQIQELNLEEYHALDKYLPTWPRV